VSDVQHFEVGDETEQIGRKFRLTDAGWKRVNPRTGGVSDLTPFERRLFKSAAHLAEAEAAHQRRVAERALEGVLE
jgi:hypothetical protein